MVSNLWQNILLACVVFAFIYAIDAAFHKSIKELLAGIWQEIREFVTLKTSPRSVNMLGGIFIFAIVLLVAMGEAGDRLLALIQPGHAPALSIPASILLMIAAFLLAVYYILSLVLCRYFPK